ncbi:MAG: AAA family ATPase [Deltaproteobacteria bacterium]|nr:AAA family ATPase [Deltaproteobacteria bacterium]
MSTSSLSDPDLLLSSTSDDRDGVALLSAYVPSLALADLAFGREREAQGMRAGLILADLQHSTRFVANLTHRGPQGLDTLQRALRAWSEGSVRVIHAAGGVVYQFAGDAILACFPQGVGEPDAALAQRVAETALRLASFAETTRAVQTPTEALELRCKFGVSMGEVHRLILGVAELWLHPLLVGDPVAAAVRAEKRASGGEVVVDIGVARHLPPAWIQRTLDDVSILVATPAAAAPSHRRDTPPHAGLAPRLLHPFLARRLSHERDELIAELRGVTCVFLKFELEGAPGPLIERLPELRAFYELAQRESLRFGGFLAQTDFTDKGNVVFVVFGAPSAVEHQELMATRFAWAILQGAESLGGVRGVRVGVATGPAYCGIIGGGGRRGYTTLGEVAHVAARLMTLSERGVLVDAATARTIAKDFALGEPTARTLKGIDHPVLTLPVLSALSSERARVVPELVGRQAARSLLRRALGAALGGGGAATLLVGEAGVGKSSLAEALAAEARGRGVHVVEGACYTYEQRTPFYPWRELLLRLLELPPTLPLPERIKRLEAEVRQVAPDDPGAGSLIVELMGWESEAPRARALDARGRRQRLSALVVQLIAGRAARGPLLLWLEDVHWADRSSLELIEHVAARLDALPVAMLITTRPSEADERLSGASGVRRCELGQLAEDEARALTRMLLALPEPRLEIETRILSRAQGNPFFIQSIVIGLRETYGDSLEGIPERAEDIALPHSVQEVLLSRLDRLGEAERALLKGGSVIGRVFALDAVRVIWSESLDGDVVDEALRRLNMAALVSIESRAPLFAAFQHVLIRDVCYTTLLPGVRQAMHRRFVLYLEEALGQGARGASALLAYHSVEGDDPDRGLRYTLMAARDARDQYANDDAIAHYRRALGLVEQAELAPDDQAAARHTVGVELAEVLVSAGKYVEAVELLQAGRAAARDDQERAEIQEGLGRAYQERGDSHLAIDALEASLGLYGRRAPRSLLSLVPLTLMGVLTFFLGRDPEGSGSASRGPGRRQLTTLVSLIRIYYFLDIAKLAWATFAALNLGRKVASAPELSQAYTYYGTMLSGAGLLGGAERACAHGLDLARRCHDAVAEGIALSRLGTRHTFANQLDEAIALHREARAVFMRVGEQWETQTGLMLHATSHYLKGEFARALPIFDEMGELARSLNAKRHQAWRLSWSPMCRYLLGVTGAQQALEELEEAHSISASLADLANQCAALNHQANIHVLEEDAEGAAKAAVRAFGGVWRYHILVPFLQIGLVDAGEAALYALSHGAKGVPAWRLRVIVTLCMMKAQVLGILYPYLRGPALRLRARWRQWRLGPEAAMRLYERALAVLRTQPNPYELAVTLQAAAEATTGDRREALLAELAQVRSGLGLFARRAA